MLKCAIVTNHPSKIGNPEEVYKANIGAPASAAAPGAQKMYNNPPPAPSSTYSNPYQNRTSSSSSSPVGRAGGAGNIIPISQVRGRVYGMSTPVSVKKMSHVPARRSAPLHFYSSSTIPLAAIFNTPLLHDLLRPSQLNPYQNKWTIKGRITNKGDMRTWNNAKGEGCLFR